MEVSRFAVAFGKFSQKQGAVFRVFLDLEGGFEGEDRTGVIALRLKRDTLFVKEFDIDSKNAVFVVNAFEKSPEFRRISDVDICGIADELDGFAGRMLRS